MNLLVTGGAGFIGSNIVDRLIEEGHNVIIADDLSTGKKENINPKATFHNVDIRSEKLEDVFKSCKIDAVYHLAAQIDVRKSVSAPVMDADINILGGINLLNLMKKYGAKKIIYSSTGGAIYGDPQYCPADEKHPIRPMSAYGISKHCLEHYIELYHDLHGLDYTILRYANVYGKRQDPLGEAGVIAIFIGKIEKSEVPIIFGNGKQTRDFVHIDDVVSANVAALTNGSGEIMNIGTGIETSVNEIYQCLKDLMPEAKDVKYEAERPGEVFRIALTIEKAKSILKWEPKVKLYDGMKMTIGNF